jgi:hypothetical protein
MKLILQIALGTILTSILLVPAAQAASRPGISPEQAATRIEFNVRLVDNELVADAQERVRIALALGGPQGALRAKRALTLAKAGFEVDHAACLGTRRAPGGYTAFTCKLTLSIALGYEAKARGTYTRLPNGVWRWRTAWFIR